MNAALERGGDGRFRRLSGYDLRYTVSHLISAVRAQEGETCKGSSRDFRLLIKLLADPAFALAQATAIGAEDTVADFIAGHDAVCGSSPSDARLLSKALATAAILSSASSEAVLTPQALNAQLTYRADTPAYGELLDFATDEKLISSLIPNPVDRSWIALAFLHSAATYRRRHGGKQNIDRAREMLRSARNVGIDTRSRSGHENALMDRVLSSVLYDLAYIDYLTERPSEARKGFRASAELAEKGQDKSGYYISRILERLVEFYEGKIRADELRSFLEEALNHFTSALGESPHAERWVMNVHAHLFDLACITGDTRRADAEFAMLRRDPWVARFRQLEMVRIWQARLYLAQHAWHQAVTLYESILGNELSQREEDLVREGIARDLLDYGTALAALGAVDLARRVWQRGVLSSNYASGWPWKAKISHRLAEPDSLADVD